MRQIVLLFLLFSLTMNASGQLNFLDFPNSRKLQDTVDYFFEHKSPCVIFFCPFNNPQPVTLEEDRILYNHYYDQLQKRLRFYNIDTPNLIYAKIGTVYNVKKAGAYFYDKSRCDSIYVDLSATECYLINFDSQFVNRSAKKYQLVVNQTQIANVIKMDFKGQCPTKKASILSFYEEFIPEAIKPKYDTNELIEMILGKIEKLSAEILTIKKAVLK